MKNSFDNQNNARDVLYWIRIYSISSERRHKIGVANHGEYCQEAHHPAKRL